MIYLWIELIFYLMASKYDENGKRITGKMGMKEETVVSQRVSRLMSETDRRFNEKERTVIMQLVRASHYDYNEMGKLLGIHPKTLRQWRHLKLSEEIDSMAKATIDQLVLRTKELYPEDGMVVIPNATEALERVDMGIDKIIDDAVKARRLAINRILQIIPDEKRVDNLLAVIKEMTLVIQSDSDLIKEGGGGILPALNKLSNNANINQEELLSSIMSQLPKSNFVQINNYQKTEDVEPIQEKIKTEENE